MRLSEQTLNILRNTLGITNVSDIAHRPFKDLPDDVSHDELAAYSSKGRGSVRLATGRFFAPNKLKIWADKVCKLKLP